MWYCWKLHFQPNHSQFFSPLADYCLDTWREDITIMRYSNVYAICRYGVGSAVWFGWNYDKKYRGGPQFWLNWKVLSAQGRAKELEQKRKKYFFFSVAHSKFLQKQSILFLYHLVFKNMYQDWLTLKKMRLNFSPKMQ